MKPARGVMMAAMDIIANHAGVFTVFDNTGYSTEELRAILRAGVDPHALAYLSQAEERKNILMAPMKALMARSVYPLIAKLVLTTQTATPVDTETAWSGTIYQTVASDEVTRDSDDSNPYRVGWNIASDGANGNWGSFVLATEGGAIINRALAGVTKTAGAAKLVIFQGRVTS